MYFLTRLPKIEQQPTYLGCLPKLLIGRQDSWNEHGSPSEHKSQVLNLGPNLIMDPGHNFIGQVASVGGREKVWAILA